MVEETQTRAILRMAMVGFEILFIVVHCARQRSCRSPHLHHHWLEHRSDPHLVNQTTESSEQVPAYSSAMQIVTH
ncbi:hypothetical protein MUK42_17676 [Musa troglodytarum]|uniref:Uncharacterized protein n=1 Tax=Musa troglodytarum TaxID=320322 RepID=A0A9E7H2T4_9LILI|nr:hypothetical protein MUK42_17676 [Musa troglodytarum]